MITEKLPPNITFRAFANKDRSAVSALILQLYIDDPSIKQVTPAQIARTFDELLGHPDKGNIMVFDCNGEIAGYSILINFWSNEYGGNILYIDELFVKDTFRGQGIGTQFLRFLAQNPPHQSIALQLEVTPGNVKARKLYQSLGFVVHKNDRMTLELSS